MAVTELLKRLDPTRDAVMLCGHGSRSHDAVQQFEQFAAQIRAQLDPIPVAYGFLEFATPIIHQGLEELRARGVRRILAIPGMLFAAGHAKNDIPSVLRSWQARHSDIELLYGRELALDTRMVRAAGDRINDALTLGNQQFGTMPRDEIMLVVVGRGASDPDANANVAKITRLLWEGLGLGWAETAYSGVTFPLVAPALAHAARLGFRRVILFPYFLFTGILIKRIYDAGDAAGFEAQDIQLIKASYLRDHPLVVETAMARIVEILDGTGVMNCQMCKYREQVLGFEDEVGLAQASHHHHVEGIGTNGDAAEHDHHGHHHHGDGHGHHHGSGDHHGHHPYPHADHRLGPKTLKA
ncbi:MAG: sirohydrochlorin chelatase [Pseudomonadota bacterium]